MSANSLYTIENLQVAGGSVNATIRLNAAHPVFEGHFPGQPVFPGACMLDIVKDLASTALQKELRLMKADNLKFITPVDPLVSDTLQIDITYQLVDGGLKVKAVLYAGSPCMKMDGVYSIS